MKFEKVSLDVRKFPGYVEFSDRETLRIFFSLLWVLLRTENEPLEQLEKVMRNAKTPYDIECEQGRMAPDIEAALEYLGLEIEKKEHPFAQLADDLIAHSRHHSFISCEGKFRISDFTTSSGCITHYPFNYSLFSSHFDADAFSFLFLLNDVNLTTFFSEYLHLTPSYSTFSLACELAREDGSYICDIFELLGIIQHFLGQSFDTRQTVNIFRNGFDSIRNHGSSIRSNMTPSVVWMISDEVEMWYTLRLEIDQAQLSACDDQSLFLEPIIKNHMLLRPVVRIIIECMMPRTNEEGEVIFGKAPFIGSERKYIASIIADISENLRSFVLFPNSPLP